MSEMSVAEIAVKVDEMAKWDKFLKEGKKILDELKAELQKEGVSIIEQGYVKQVVFNGSEGNRVVVTASETVELVYPGILQSVFGSLADNILDQDISFKPKLALKKLAQSVFNGQYGEKTKVEVISSLGADSKTEKLLNKRLKGNIKKDMEAIEAILGLGKELGEELATEVAEAVVFEQLTALAEASGKGFEDVVSAIRNAMIVDEGIKIGVEYPAVKPDVPELPAEIRAEKGETVAA